MTNNYDSINIPHQVLRAGTPVDRLYRCSSRVNASHLLHMRAERMFLLCFFWESKLPLARGPDVVVKECLAIYNNDDELLAPC